MESLERLERFEKLITEIQAWIEYEPETLKRYKLFYESIVSISLGGEGLQTLINNTKTPQDAKLTLAMYKLNYPNKKE